MTTRHLIAYLDPGSSGVIIQMIGGGLAAFLVAVKIYGRRVMRVLHLRRRDPSDATTSAPVDDHAQ